MFDPTIYENLKVVIEGAIYDQDLNGVILVTAREDLIDLASLSRRFHIAFQIRDRISQNNATAWIKLRAHVRDLSAEILGTANPDTELGCQLTVNFETAIKNVEATFDISQKLYKIWDFPPKITQTVSYEITDGLLPEGAGNKPTEEFKVDVRLDFMRKINEQQIVDIEEILRLAIVSLHQLNADEKNQP